MLLSEINSFFQSHPLKEQYFSVNENERAGTALVAERDVNAEEVYSKWLLGNNQPTRKSQNVASYHTHVYTKYVTPHKSLTLCELVFLFMSLGFPGGLYSSNA